MFPVHFCSLNVNFCPVFSFNTLVIMTLTLNKVRFKSKPKLLLKQKCFTHFELAFTGLQNSYTAITQRRSGVFIVNFELFSQFFLLFLLLTLNR